MRKTECPNCGGTVNDNGFCEKCGLSFERAMNLQRAKRADRLFYICTYSVNNRTNFFINSIFEGD